MRKFPVNIWLAYKQNKWDKSTFAGNRTSKFWVFSNLCLSSTLCDFVIIEVLCPILKPNLAIDIPKNSTLQRDPIESKNASTGDIHNSLILSATKKILHFYWFSCGSSIEEVL